MGKQMRRGVEPNQIQDKQRVIYYPSLGGPGFEGTVRGDVFIIGDDTRVVHLINMEKGYGEYVGKEGIKRNNVYAASLNSIELLRIGY